LYQIVNFTAEEKEFCKDFGIARWTENRGSRDIASYDPRRFNLTSKQSNVLAVLAEYSVVKYLGLDHTDEKVWVPYVPRAEYHKIKEPDILGFIEVRRCNKPGNPMPIRTKDVEKEAAVVSVAIPYIVTDTGAVDLDGDLAIIRGWHWAVEAWEIGSIPSWSSQSKDRVIGKTKFKNPNELHTLIEEKEAS